MRKVTLFALISFLVTTTLSTAHAGMWQLLNGKTPPNTNTQAVFPATYNLYRMDQERMASTLEQSGTEPTQGTIISLPAPDGSSRNFRVWETPVLPQELQSQHPDIRTYTAVATDDANITAKLDYTMYGFHAIVFGDGDNTYMIDPFSRKSDGYYLVYYKNDLMQTSYQDGVCGVSEEAQEQLTQGIKDRLVAKTGKTAARSNGGTRRTYRAAISCTGEYAVLVTDGAPSTAAVLAVITSTINRCNGVFERELSVTLELIPNENTVIYLNPETDPYDCNLTNDCLINEVQSNLDDVLAGFTYDIGHIFNTAGGGLAALASSCTPAKASGVSGTSGAEDFGVIIHEMGHQFGAPHTFNANTGTCNGNGSEPTAYEPGSGSTIMSYAGGCAPNNVAGGSDDYYNVSSLRFMTDHLVFGEGATCGTTATALPPISLPDNTDTFYIPQNTPFELLAPEIIPTGGIAPVVTYCWEQYDLGNFDDTEAAAADWDAGPTFRSFPPTPVRLRTFPQLDLVMSGAYTAAGQRLSKTQRQLTFKLTARSLDLGWGTFNYTETPVVVRVAQQADFRVTGPAVTELYEVGATKTITWDVAGTDTMPINCGLVNIQMSTDGGETFIFTIATSVPNTGSFNFTVPDVYSDDVIFKVKGAGNIFFDANKIPVRIHGTPVSLDNLDSDNNFQVYPNPATAQLTLNSTQPVSSPLNISIVNVLGQEVYKGSMMQKAVIDVQHFARGNYFVHIQDLNSDKKTVRKIVLQ